MNELTLSKDLNRIETEIQFYKEKAGESIWEIGRRLIHVKENKLVHGEFMKWVEDDLSISYQTANKMMRIAEELPNFSTSRDLGTEALYLIATLPEEEREKEHATDAGEVKTPDQMTVRELQELKKQLKEKDEKISELENKPPEIIEKEVVKEVVPPHLEGLVSDNRQLEKRLREVEEEKKSILSRNEFIEKSYRGVIDQRKAVDKTAQEYEELKESIAKMQGKMTGEQKRLLSMKKLSRLVKESTEFLYKIAPINYWEDFNVLKGDAEVAKEIIDLVERTEKWCREMRKHLNTDILEGEIIDD